MSRCYADDGIEWPSVTTILSELGKGDALTQWAANCAIEYVQEQLDTNTLTMENITDILGKARTEWRNVGKEAMDTGSEVHRLIEGRTAHLVHAGQAEVVDDVSDQSEPTDVSRAFDAFKQWEAENIAEWLESEHTVICREHGYAGTLDAVARLKTGGVYVIDFKSSKAIYDEYYFQISAYRFAYKKPVDGMGILRLDKETGLPEWRDCSKVYEQKRDAFHALVKFWYLAKNRRLKNNPFVGGKK